MQLSAPPEQAEGNGIVSSRRRLRPRSAGTRDDPEVFVLGVLVAVRGDITHRSDPRRERSERDA